MTANFAQRFRTVAWLLLAAIATAGIGLFFGTPTSATANTYVFGGQGGSVANETSIKIDYVWRTDGDRVATGLEGPFNLEAVWTNTATSESTISPIANRTTTTSLTLVEVQTPVNTWPAGTKVRLEIRPKAGSALSALNGINNTNYTTSVPKMWEVLSLGNYPSMSRMVSTFRASSTSLRISAALPATVRNLEYAFSFSDFDGDISGWDTSNVDNMQFMFYYADFNQPIGSWNVGKVQSMKRMFSENRNFNQDLSSWNVDRVQDMDFMFAFASLFNNGDQTSSFTVSGAKPLTWNTPSLSAMSGMFYAADKFNQNVNSFNTSRVANLSDVFYSANVFNNGDPVGAYIGDTVSSAVDMTWTTSAATSFVNMFREAKNFNQNLNTWDVRRAKSFGYMFSGTDINNVSVGSDFNNGYAAGVGATLSWTLTTSPSIFMNSMFENNRSFNQNLNSLGFSAVINLGGFMSNAGLFNNGFAVGAPGVASWGVTGAVSVDYMFRGASAFNQDLNSWDMSQVTSLMRMFSQATRFNNGDLTGAFEGDTASSDVRMLWNTGNVTNLDNAFTEATNFNQNISSWNVSKVTSMDYTFGTSNVINGMFNNGASSVSSNVMPWSTSALTRMYGTFAFQPLFNADISAWSTSKLTTLTSAFSSASRFNQDISNWDTSKVTHFGWTFLNARAFNQPIGKWTVSAATNYLSMLNGPSSFSQDLSNWGPFTKANTDLGSLFGAGAPSMGDSPKKWNITGVTNFDNFFASSSVATSSAISSQSIRSIIGGWSLQKVQPNRTTGYFRTPLYTNCQEWSAYWRLKYNNSWTFNGSGVHAPTAPTCNTVNVTWSPTSTISYSTGTVTPSATATTDGPSGVKYARYHAGTTGCNVDPDSGVITHTTSGSCQVVAYDADTNSNTATPAAFRVVTFTLPTPGAQSLPGAPTTISARASISALSVTFSAPASNGGLPLLGYEVGYSLTQGGATTWVSVSPVVTSSSTLSFTLSGLVNGTSYWVKARAINSIGAGTASSEFGPVIPATTPSAPSIASSTISAGTVLLNLGAPGTNGGSAITTYEYRFATNSSAVLSASWTSSATTSTAISASGLVNGTSYFFQVRAVNSIGAGSATGVSSAITPITTASPPVIYQSNKVGYLTTAEIQFFAPADNGGSAILDYQVRMSTNEGGTWTNWSNQAVTYNVNNQRWYINLSGLQGDFNTSVYYTFELRARNAAGFSGTSLQVPSGAPITSVDFGNQQAVVNFKAAKYDGNSAILGYEYQYRTGTFLNPTTISPWVSISPSVWAAATTTSAASFTVSGLANGITHNFWVRAVNAIGGDDRPYWNWVDNAGTPDKQLPTISFSYSVGSVAYTQSASYSPSVSSNSLGDITFSTTTPTKCSVATLSGVVTNINAGLCTIQLSQAESPTYSATTVLRYISTTMINQPTLQISASATSSPYLGTVTLTFSGGAGAGAVTYTAVVGSACVVSGNVVTVGNAGSSCAVIATKVSDGNYNSANSSQISISTIRINQATLTFSNLAEMPARSSMSVSAIGGSGEGVLRYRVSSAGGTGCSLSGTTLTATTAGQCTIEASRASSTNYTVSASVSQVIEVVKSVQTVRFTTNVPAQPLVGSTYSPGATASSALSISFSVSGGGCSLASGTITFTAAGDCRVEASQTGDGAYLAAPTASQTIAVGRRNHTLAFSTTSQNITAKTFGDQAFVLGANSTEADAQVAFTLSPQTTNDACSVFSTGLVLVLNVGDCVIEAYSTQTQALAAASTISKRIEIRADKASAPFITSVAMGNLSITAGFTPPSYIGGSSVSAYTVVAIDQTPNSTVEVSDSSCDTTLVNGQVSCRIAGLENGKSYKIRAAAINGAGDGEFSVLSPAITVATNPAAVQNLRVIQGASTLAISWDDPDSLGGGTFSSYRVYVKRSSTSSYDADHYFNVTNQNTRNITISAETPPDGMTHPGGPALVNGIAYDIKVVTVTTANTQELTGNTAVVNQIPRTVPEPPRLASALVVANKLVLTWTAPLSDGGAAVTSYSATVGNSPCLFAAADDTYCEIALPTAPGNYVFAIKAENVAGFSPEIQGVFTVASYNSPAPQTSGGSVVTTPPTAADPAPLVSGVSFSADKKQVLIRGSFLKGITKIVIGGIETRILSQTSEMIILAAPALAAGSHSVFLHLTDKTVLKFEKDLVVAGTKPTVTVKKTSVLTGFKPGSSLLTPKMKKDLLVIFKANRGSKSMQCVGHTQGPSILKSDARLAMKRAIAVCTFAKKSGFKVVSASYQNNKLVGAKFRRVDLVFTK